MTLLVIEDEYPIALEIESLLRDAGFESVVLAATECDGLEKVQGGDWDAVIADANLNGRGIQRVAGVLSDRLVPLLVVTGYSRENLPEEIRHLPMISKPFEGANLVQALMRILPYPSAG